jgi:cation diffusion facilitator CzcD-associated flavoprotein CzcO
MFLNLSAKLNNQAEMVSKKVCVVGAGMAGLAAARELRREGHSVTVMEHRGDVGGQWLYDPRTDAGDPLGVAAPVKVHSSMYESVRLLSPRETMGVSDFQFLPTSRHGGDARRFPERHEVFRYLKDFCGAFRMMDIVRLHTKVVRVAMAGEGGSVRWQVRSVRVDPDSGEEVAAEAEEELFDAVVVANGHYSQPKLPAITGTLWVSVIITGLIQFNSIFVWIQRPLPDGS